MKTATDLAAKLLSEAHVVVVPGEAFGTAEHIRLSYAVSPDVIDKGVERMREYFAHLVRRLSESRIGCRCGFLLR